MKSRRKRFKSAYRSDTDWHPPKQSKDSPATKQRGRRDGNGSNRAIRKVRGSPTINDADLLLLIEDKSLGPPLGGLRLFIKERGNND